MRKRRIIAAAIVLGLAAGVIALVAGGGDESPARSAEPVPGLPHVEIVSPRNGSRQENRSVVVKLKIENFKLAPLHFGDPPELGEGHIKFSLNRVPDCVDPDKLQRALDSPFGSGRLIGRSLDFPKHSGPNGVLAERIGTAGLYSPATLPEIYYERLPPGFYRLIITLARNDGTSTPFHAVTNFEILFDPRRLESGAPLPPEPDCEGKTAAAEAATQIR
jgi:hypothetical protein